RPFDVLRCAEGPLNFERPSAKLSNRSVVQQARLASDLPIWCRLRRPLERVTGNRQSSGILAPGDQRLAAPAAILDQQVAGASWRDGEKYARYGRRDLALDDDRHALQGAVAGE